MKQLFLSIIFIGIMQAFAQHKQTAPNWHDKRFISATLKDTCTDKKIVVVELGKKATIYLKLKLVKKNAVETKNAYNKKELNAIIHILDSSAAVSDTVFMDNYLAHLDYLVSQQLQDGNAAVFYKKMKVFVPAISHRLEKYGLYAYRFFYLPDKRPFYSVMEYSGILENDKYFSDPNELLQLGRKLAGLRKE